MFIFIASLLLARENPFVLPDQNLDATQKEMKKQVVTKEPMAQKKPVVELHEKKFKKEPSLKSQLLDLGFLQILQRDNHLSIVTRDKLKKSFLIDRPKKVVFDFKTRRSFATKKIQAKPPFKKIIIGAHKTFYRVAIEVESGCQPKVDKQNLTIECR